MTVHECRCSYGPHGDTSSVERDCDRGLKDLHEEVAYGFMRQSLDLHAAQAEIRRLKHDVGVRDIALQNLLRDHDAGETFTASWEAARDLGGNDD